MEFSRPEYRSGLPFPSPGDLPNPRIKPGSSALQADSLPSEPSAVPYAEGVAYRWYCGTTSTLQFHHTPFYLLVSFIHLLIHLFIYY